MSLLIDKLKGFHRDHSKYAQKLPDVCVLEQHNRVDCERQRHILRLHIQHIPLSHKNISASEASDINHLWVAQMRMFRWRWRKLRNWLKGFGQRQKQNVSEIHCLRVARRDDFQRLNRNAYISLKYNGTTWQQEIHSGDKRTNYKKQGNKENRRLCHFGKAMKC